MIRTWKFKVYAPGLPFNQLGLTYIGTEEEARIVKGLFADADKHVTVYIEDRKPVKL